MQGHRAAPAAAAGGTPLALGRRDGGGAVAPSPGVASGPGPDVRGPLESDLGFAFHARAPRPKLGPAAGAAVAAPRTVDAPRCRSPDAQAVRRGSSQATCMVASPVAAPPSLPVCPCDRQGRRLLRARNQSESRAATSSAPGREPRARNSF